MKMVAQSLVGSLRVGKEEYIYIYYIYTHIYYYFLNICIVNGEDIFLYFLHAADN